MIDEICVIGQPSLCGGADTELLDQIQMWSDMGVWATIIPTSDVKDNINLSRYNTRIEEIRDYKKCLGKHVISFCNPYFLKDIAEIRKYAKTISWVNCMCFNFKEEINAHLNGYIDYFLYQTKHQYQKCAPALVSVNRNYNIFHIKPWFDDTRFPYIEDRKEIVIGRISRASLSKFNKNQFKIFKNFKDIKCIILGWKDELYKKVDSEDLVYMNYNDNIKLYKEREITQQDFYKQCSILCMTTDTYENYPRVAFEAMSSGSVLVVDNRGGWKDIIDNGKTGFLCNNTKEFIEVIKNLIDNPKLLKSIAKNARTKLDTDFSYNESVSSWTKFFELLSRNH